VGGDNQGENRRRRTNQAAAIARSVRSEIAKRAKQQPIENCRAVWRVGADHAPFTPPQKPQIGGKCYVYPDRARHPL